MTISNSIIIVSGDLFDILEKEYKISGVTRVLIPYYNSLMYPIVTEDFSYFDYEREEWERHIMIIDDIPQVIWMRKLC